MRPAATLSPPWIRTPPPASSPGDLFHIAVVFTASVPEDVAAAIESTFAGTYATPLSERDTHALSAMHGKAAPIAVYRRDSPAPGAVAAAFTVAPVDRRCGSGDAQFEDERILTAHAFPEGAGHDVDLRRDVARIVLSVIRETPGRATSARSVLAAAVDRFAARAHTRALFYSTADEDSSTVVRGPYFARAGPPANNAWEAIILDAAALAGDPERLVGTSVVTIEPGVRLFDATAHFALRYLILRANLFALLRALYGWKNAAALRCRPCAGLAVCRWLRAIPGFSRPAHWAEPEIAGELTGVPVLGWCDYGCEFGRLRRQC